MALKSQAELSAAILPWIESQTKTSVETAKKDFADGLAKIILETIMSADVKGVMCSVSGAAGSVPVTGNATQTNVVKLT